MDYTKGEWEYDRPVIKVGSREICILAEPHYMPDTGDRTWYDGCAEAMKANAQLISASPDLYEALKELAEDALPEYMALAQTEGEIATRQGLIYMVEKALAKAEVR